MELSESLIDIWITEARVKALHKIEHYAQSCCLYHFTYCHLVSFNLKAQPTFHGIDKFLSLYKELELLALEFQTESVLHGVHSGLRCLVGSIVKRSVHP